MIKLRGYISDKKYCIFFYLILMVFISLVTLLDSDISVSFDNVLYINLVAFFLLLFYLTAGYIYYKSYYNSLEGLIDNKEGDIIYHLPEPLTYRQKIHHKLLIKVYNEQSRVIEKQNLEKRENKEFVTTWFHQIKTPIAVIRLIMEDSMKNSIDKTKKELIKSMSEEIDKIESQVEQALYYSKIDVFEKDYFIQQLNLDQVVSSVIKKHARVFISKKIELEKKDINTFVNSDKKWLSFIIDQILSNSLKYTEKKGKISVRVEINKNKKVLIINDTGIGIKEEDLPRVFDKGFTGYMGRREEKSTGIGLYLAKKLAKRLGHDISIKSKFGEYTEVKLIFPRLISFYDLIK